jgi:hypothetical protein
MEIRFKGAMVENILTREGGNLDKNEIDLMDR